MRRDILSGVRIAIGGLDSAFLFKSTDKLAHLLMAFALMRKVRPIHPEIPYHLCARTNERVNFGPPLEIVWTCMENYLHFLHFVYDVKIHSFVLMPNHFHMIATFPLANFGPAMNYFMRETSREISRAAGRENHLYGTRVYRSALSSFRYFTHAYKYVYRNPVEAGLAMRVEYYSFSTLQSLLGLKHGMTPLEEDTLLFDDVEFQLNWLNRRPDVENRKAVKNGLRKPKFELALNRKNRRPNELETGWY
jgi:putative transposase